ncbi:MAG: hypothetical protein HZA50_02205, partial [Planctomycetes bacterium]|nr:hypothetical protein [Planctomycetota bacterium]
SCPKQFLSNSDICFTPSAALEPLLGGRYLLHHFNQKNLGSFWSIRHLFYRLQGKENVRVFAARPAVGSDIISGGICDITIHQLDDCQLIPVAASLAGPAEMLGDDSMIFLVDLGIAAAAKIHPPAVDGT